MTLPQILQVSLLLQDLESQNRLPQVAQHASPPFPVGTTDAECCAGGQDVTTMDEVTGREFYQIIRSPARLTATSDADARYLSNVPDFANSGMTLTFWYRHINCPVKTCGVYLIHAGDFQSFGGAPSSSEWCWTLWIENEGIWTDGHANSGYLYFDDHGVGDTFKPQDDFTWRHIAYQFDEVDDVTRFFLDGDLVYSHPYGKPVSQADCVGAGKRWTLGHSHPGYTYGREVEVADMRMYPHAGGAGKMTQAQILSIATANTASIPLDQEFKCRDIQDPSMVRMIIECGIEIWI